MTTTEQMTVEQVLGKLGARIDRLLDTIKTSGVATKARADLGNEFKRIDEEITTARVRIDDDLADGKEALITALRAELDVWKGRLEELRVQADLGRMELRDRLTIIADRLDEAIGAIRRDIREIEERGDVAAGLEPAVGKEMRSLRREFETAEELMR